MRMAFFASSRFSQMRRAAGLQVPQRVFIFRMRTSATRSPTFGSHLATSGRHTISELAAVPPVEHGFPLIPVRPRSNLQPHPRVVEKADGRGAGALDHIEAVAPALEVVALAGHELALGLANLPLEFGLPPPNPSQA